MIGKRFGKLVVVSEGTKRKGDRQSRWICQCDCGNTTHPINGYDLRNGHTQSCGCLHKETMSKNKTTHGKSKTKAYNIHQGIKARCFNPKERFYGSYGGRGITVCDEWKDDFQAFYDYVSKLPHFDEEGYSLDRMNNNGNYEPGNVRWATSSEQGNNKRNCHKIEFNGKTHSITEWSKQTGIKRETIYYRLKHGWTNEKILTTKVKGRKNE